MCVVHVDSGFFNTALIGAHVKQWHCDSKHGILIVAKLFPVALAVEMQSLLHPLRSQTHICFKCVSQNSTVFLAVRMTTNAIRCKHKKRPTRYTHLNSPTHTHKHRHQNCFPLMWLHLTGPQGLGLGTGVAGGRA